MTGVTRFFYLSTGPRLMKLRRRKGNPPTMMIQKSKSEMARAFQSIKSQLANARDKTEKVAEKSIGAALTVGAGYGTGYVVKSFPAVQKVPGTQIDSVLVVGVLGLVAGVSGIAGKQSQHVLDVSEGVLAGYAALKAADVL